MLVFVIHPHLFVLFMFLSFPSVFMFINTINTTMSISTTKTEKKKKYPATISPQMKPGNHQIYPTGNSKQPNDDSDSGMDPPSRALSPTSGR